MTANTAAISTTASLFFESLSMEGAWKGRVKRLRMRSEMATYRGICLKYAYSKSTCDYAFCVIPPRSPSPCGVYTEV